MRRELTIRFAIATILTGIFGGIVVGYYILVPADQQKWMHDLLLGLATIIIWIPTHRFLHQKWVPNPSKTKETVR